VFLSHLSHEVRTPLNAAMLGIQYVQETIVNTAVMAIVGYVPMKENSGVLAALQDAMESTELAVNVLNEMLLYDRLQSGSVSLEKEDIRIWDFLKEAMKPFLLPVSIMRRI